MATYLGDPCGRVQHSDGTLPMVEVQGDQIYAYENREVELLEDLPLKRQQNHSGFSRVRNLSDDALTNSTNRTL